MLNRLQGKEEGDYVFTLRLRKAVIIIPRLLKLWVRIPAWAWMFVVSVVCCQVEVSATD